MLLFVGHVTLLQEEGWPALVLRPHSSLEGVLGVSDETIAAFLMAWDFIPVAVYASVGILVMARRSDEWIGIYSSLVLIGIGVGFTYGANSLGELAPNRYPILELLQVAGWIAFLIYMTLFPDGRFVPRWTVVTSAVGLLIIFVLVSPIVPDDSWTQGPVLIVLVALLGTAMFSAIFRYAVVSDDAQRQQTKWVVAAFILIAAFAVVRLAMLTALGTEVSGTGRTFVVVDLVSDSLNTLSFAFFPIAIGISILRYRLWEIDTLINRGLVYAILTAALIILYFASVTAIQFAFRAFTGQGTPLAIVASTLLIAALSNPLRQRIQGLIDRRFYRSRYDMARTLERFAAIARDEVDLDELSGTLLEVVGESMHPEQVMLWMKE